METANSMDLPLHPFHKASKLTVLCSGWGNSLGRIPQPDRTIFSLYDYRKRLATYRTDLDLQLSYQNYAWIPVWDDHGRSSCNLFGPDILTRTEVSDNTYRDGSSKLHNDEESFLTHGGVSVDQHKMNAVRAYFEWMPIRSASNSTLFLPQ